jgi:hypothetical protein
MRISAAAVTFITLAWTLAVSTIAASTIASAANEKNCQTKLNGCINWAPLSCPPPPAGTPNTQAALNKQVAACARYCRAEYKVCTEANLLETKKTRSSLPALPKDTVDASAKSEASKVMLNPQPLPPKDKIDAKIQSKASKAILDQLPSRDKVGASATSLKATRNPQPLPPVR